MIKSTLTLGLDFPVSAYSLARMSDGPKQNPVTSIKNATLLTAAIFAPGRIEFAVSASGVADAAGIDREAKVAVNTLYASNLTAQLVGKNKVHSRFPRIIKGGLYGGTRSTVMRPCWSMARLSWHPCQPRADSGL